MQLSQLCYCLDFYTIFFVILLFYAFSFFFFFFFFQAEDGIRDLIVTGVQTLCSSDLGGRRLREIAVAAIGVIALGTVGWFVFPRAAKQQPTQPVGRTHGEAHSVVLVVRAQQPFIVVIGDGPSPAALTVPPHLQLELAGQGSGTTENLAPLPGDSLRVDLSNVLGM